MRERHGIESNKQRERTYSRTPPVFATGDSVEFIPSAPLKVRQLGLLGSDRFQDKLMYDDKMMDRAEFRFDGVKGGISWKATMETYLYCKCQMIMQILK